MKRRTGCHLNVSSVIQHPAFVAGVARHFPSTACLCIPLLDSWFREVYSFPSLAKLFAFMFSVLGTNFAAFPPLGLAATVYLCPGIPKMHLLSHQLKGLLSCSLLFSAVLLFLCWTQAWLYSNLNLISASNDVCWAHGLGFGIKHVLGSWLEWEATMFQN